jgi:hypothetical protein
MEKALTNAGDEVLPEDVFFLHEKNKTITVESKNILAILIGLTIEYIAVNVYTLHLLHCLRFHLYPANRLLPDPELIQSLCPRGRTGMGDRLSNNEFLLTILENFDNP